MSQSSAIWESVNSSRIPLPPAPLPDHRVYGCGRQQPAARLSCDDHGARLGRQRLVVDFLGEALDGFFEHAGLPSGLEEGEVEHDKRLGGLRLGCVTRKKVIASNRPRLQGQAMPMR